ncbi:Caspase-3 [Branchiostoma belcheri]|nr:Caspase-3 [Branchiostoma belcheri]
MSRKTYPRPGPGPYQSRIPTSPRAGRTRTRIHAQGPSVSHQKFHKNGHKKGFISLATENAVAELHAAILYGLERGTLTWIPTCLTHAETDITVHTQGSVSRGNVQGAELPTAKLAEAFQSLPVRIKEKNHENLDLSTMLHVLQDEANRDHTAEDFSIWFIMSHGIQGNVFATDGFSAELIDIFPSLTGTSASLFSACQGDKDQTVAECAYSDSKPSPSAILAHLSTEADSFLARATVPGIVAYKREDALTL